MYSYKRADDFLESMENRVKETNNVYMELNQAIQSKGYPLELELAEEHISISIKESDLFEKYPAHAGLVKDGFFNWVEGIVGTVTSLKVQWNNNGTIFWLSLS